MCNQYVGTNIFYERKLGAICDTALTNQKKPLLNIANYHIILPTDSQKT